ncbi:GNAT family N-acetyltransferase [Thalassospira sp. MA62]|nr:GNAT family N-acetyltransferase [Thalassospira sp. MA62]
MIEISKVTDVEALRHISIQTFTETFARHNTEEHLNAYLEKAYATEQLKRELAHPDSHFYFAHVDGELAGYLKVNVRDAQSEPMGADTIEIERIYVFEAFQGHGVGKALFIKATELAKELHKRKMWLGVWERNERAIRFYRRNGFEQTGVHTFFMGEDAQNDLIFMRSFTD